MTYIDDPVERLRVTEEAQAEAAAHAKRLIDHSPARAISAALAAAGVTVKAKQAAIVGERKQHWSGYWHGHQSPSCAKVQAWLVRARAAGYDVGLAWTADGAS